MNGAAGANYNNAYFDNKRLVPQYGMKFNDEDPRYRNTNEYRSALRKKRLYISDKDKEYGEVENFSVIINQNIKNIRYIKPVKVNISYTVPDPAIIYNCFVYFPDFNNSELLSNGKPYHCYIPVTQGTVGNDVIFNYSFEQDYISDFNNLNNIPEKLRVKVYKENSSGTISLFDDLNFFSIELELNYFDHLFRNDKDIN